MRKKIEERGHNHFLCIFQINLKVLKKSSQDK